jgi:hypothetical protein
MNRRILINEDERSRILGLHENRRKQEWSFLFEQDTQLQASGQATLNFQTAKFADVQSCKAEGRQGPAALVAKFGLNWGQTQKKWLDSKCNGKTPCDKLGPSNTNLTDALCEGTFGAASASPVAQTTTGSATGTTFVIDDKPTVLNTDQEISNMVKSKKITKDTLVFKSPEIPNWTKISDLPETSLIKKAVMSIIATVPPDLPGKTKTFLISPDGIQASKSYTEEQLTAAIKDGSLSRNAQVEVRDASGMATYQPIMQNVDAAKIVNLASGPVALQQEMPSTGNKTLDQWLKTQSGQTYLSKPDRPAQEAFIDYLEQSGDPIIASIGGKEALRKILLGDVNKDTKFGRWLQRGGNKFKNVGKVLKGQNVVANTGYNPKRP